MTFILKLNRIISIKVNKAEGENLEATKRILELAKGNNGVITTSMIVKHGILRGNLKYLVDTGKLEKSARGVYTLPDILDDEFVNLQSRFKKGIFSHDSALFLLGLTDRTPNKFHMTFPATYNISHVKAENVQCTQVSAKYYDLGVRELKTPNGHWVFAYGAERTLCDIIKPRYIMDIQVITDAFKKYVELKHKNIVLLSEYAQLLKVESRVRMYLQVLL